jgi:hypothetical protein
MAPSPMDVDVDKLPEAVFEKIGLSREEFKAVQTQMAERDARTPAAGTPAPDFAIERLSPDGKRTGETFSLSSTRGRPVALVFGSYT